AALPPGGAARDQARARLRAAVGALPGMGAAETRRSAPSPRRPLRLAGGARRRLVLPEAPAPAGAGVRLRRRPAPPRPRAQGPRPGPAADRGPRGRPLSRELPGRPPVEK